MKYKLNKRKFAKFICTAAAVAAVTAATVDFIKYPESYITTWRYQLQNSIESGNEEAAAYYQKNYVDNGRILFK